VRGAPDVAASTFRLDIKAAEVHGAFRDAGIRTVLLKGRSIAALLYPEPGTRPYDDVDLLVDPEALSRAEQLLRRWDFEVFDPESPARQTDGELGPEVGAQGRHSRAWLRSRDTLVVDLHDNLPQIGSDPRQAWKTLEPHLTTLSVGGTDVEVLDEPATALLITLHAAHHGEQWRTTATEDLERATATFGSGCWASTLALARELRAERAMGAGLGFTERGREIGRQLGIETDPTPALELLWSGAPWSATFVDAFRNESSQRARARMAARVLWPSPDAMRRGSALSRRGRRGMAAAYLLRILQLGRRLPAALWHGARPRG